MNKSDAQAYVQRWEAVAEIERQERKAPSVADNWRQLNAIRHRARRLGITRQDDDGEMELFLLWGRLRAEYATRQIE